MAKVFEDYFSEALTDMIDICAEYADYRADKVFVYCMNENGTSTAQFFFQYNGYIADLLRINNVLRPGESPIDTSPDVQGQVLNILFQDQEKIEKACKQFGREIPTEIFLTYDANTKAFDAKCSYEPYYSKHPKENDFDRVSQWMSAEAKKTGKKPQAKLPYKVK